MCEVSFLSNEESFKSDILILPYIYIYIIYFGSKHSLMQVLLKRMAHSLIIFFLVFSNLLNNLILEGSL